MIFMRKQKSLLKRNHIFRSLAVRLLVQILIIVLFIGLLSESRPVALEDTIQRTICVDKTDYRRVFSERRFYIYADSVKYTFASGNHGYSNSALSKTISAGDQLSIVYYEDSGLFGNANYIIAAQTETEVYRSLDGYYESKSGMPTIVIISFLIVELLFLGICFLYIRFHKKELVSAIKKQRKQKPGKSSQAS